MPKKGRPEARLLGLRAPVVPIEPIVAFLDEISEQPSKERHDSYR
jgi:hypothetical protein